jgi:Amidase
MYGGFQAARNAADAADARTRDGITLGPLDGAIVSIKDLFDVAGEPTRAGSKVLVDAPPASTDAAVVRRLRAGGAVIVAKTNMVEFAFSGIGLNPHYGTPGNPADRTRVPGGSARPRGEPAPAFMLGLSRLSLSMPGGRKSGSTFFKLARGALAGGLGRASIFFRSSARTGWRGIYLPAAITLVRFVLH